MEKVLIRIENEQGTIDLADKIAKLIIKANGLFLCLKGDLGAGKTFFVSNIAKFLNIEEKVTSPSFVILNEYKSGVLPLYHFDLYRLENEGVKTIASELEDYCRTKEGIVTAVEWSQFDQGVLPQERLEIKISYGELSQNSRDFEIQAFGNNNIKFLRELKELL